ncbi:type I glyceraldehyde-3-phosphate dehydrogenase [Candidatus Peregrinibacteria bacterium]|jgi:glyceraldehyde 3-phosphate dehydrogenase|nr:type I glyceraldehyde-3-phosphate dehydrogenase [Candidatus Peregrinibacteria bacterium]MBT4055931.1 type I glyceraldehyde-3-phosphate dehydrogenase [Candidatus Peregrinibacteria bacterium]
MKPQVAINGFGRIGRAVCRIIMDSDQVELAAINDPSPKETLAHLLKYDSNFGTWGKNVECTEKGVRIGDKEIPCSADRDPAQLPWAELGIDIVLECTGVFRDRAGAGKHITAGAKKVIISAPGKDVDFTVVKGVNDKDLSPEHNIISNASCTTNCLAPFTKVLHDKFTVKRGLMTTIHAYTNDQSILDVSHKDLRRARAAAVSMIPTSTGAAKAIGEVMPELKGKLNGLSIRVPTPTVSIVDLVAEVEKETSLEEVNAALKEASEGELKGILGYNELPLVSVDYVCNPLSSIVDGLSTQVVDGTMIKILSWYDNEWGYSARTVELAAQMGEMM